MLEQTVLLLQPWQPAPDNVAAARVRPVRDGQGDLVGFVRQEPVQAPRWLRWLARAVVVAHELPDLSLVFLLRRSWGWPGSWEVLDAEERLVGTVRGHALLDGLGHLLAVIEQPNGEGRGRILAVQGRELGDYRREGEGTRLTFAAEMEGNPFAKMMVLGAVVARQQP